MAMHDVLVRVGADISDYTNSLNQAKEQMEGLNSNINSTNGQMEDQQQTAQQTGDQMQDSFDGSAKSALALGSIIASVSAGMVGALAAPIKTASDFESAFVGVEKTVSATPEQFNRIESEIRDMAKVMPRSADEIAGVAEEAGRLGLKQEDISEFTETMVKMGDASDLTASEASNSMARLMNIMGTGQDEVENLASSITHMGNESSSSESEILEMSRRLAGSATQVGLTESELVGFSSTLTDLGVRAEAGGTAMQKVFLGMNSAVSDGGEELESFASAAGMTGDEFRASFEEDASGAILEFIGGLKNMGDSGEDVNGVLQELGLNNERTKDAVLRLTSAHGKLKENMNQSTDAFEDGTALTEEAERRYDTFASKLKIAWNRVKDLAIVIGQPMVAALGDVLESLDPILGALEKAAGWFDDLSDSTKKATGKALLLIPALTSIAGGLYAVVKAASITVTAIRGIQTAIVVASTTIKAINPVFFAIAGAVAAATSAFYIFKESVDNQKEAEEELIEESEELAESAGKLNDEMKESADSYEKTIAKTGETADEYQRLADKAVELADKDELNAAEKSHLNGIIDELNEKMDGLNLKYDEEEGKLNKSSDAISNRIDYMEAEEKLTDSQERMTEISGERRQAEDKLNKVSKKRKKIEDDIFDSTMNGMIADEDSIEVKEDLQEEEKNLKERLSELGSEQVDVQETMVDSQGKISEAVKNGVKDQTISYEQLEEKHQEMVDTLTDKYEELEEEATNMFEKLPDEAEKSTDEMLEALEHNAEQVQNWADNLDKLAEKGLDEGLIQQLRDAGPEMAEEVSNLAKLPEDKIEEFNKAGKKGGDAAGDGITAGIEVSDETEQLIVGIVETMAETFIEEIQGSGFDEYGKTAIGDVEDGVEVGEESLKETVDAMPGNSMFNPLSRGVEDYDFVGIGSDAMSGVEEGIDDKSGDVEESSETVAENTSSAWARTLDMNSPSRVFFKHGQNTMIGALNGINDKGPGVISTLGGVLGDMLGVTDSGMDDVESRNDQGLSNIDSMFNLLPGNVGGYMQDMLTNGLKGKGSQQKSYMSTLSNDLINKLSSLKSGFLGAAKDAMRGLMNGLSNAAGGVFSKAKNIASNVTDTLKGALKISSPSKVTTEIGEFTGEGLAIGIQDKVKDVASKAAMLASAATPDDIRAPRIEDIDSRGMQSQMATMSAQIVAERNGLNVEHNDNRENDSAILGEIRNELRNQRQMIVELDGKTVGKAVEPHVTRKVERNNETNSRSWRGRRS